MIIKGQPQSGHTLLFNREQLYRCFDWTSLRSDRAMSALLLARSTAMTVLTLLWVRRVAPFATLEHVRAVGTHCGPTRMHRGSLLTATLSEGLQSWHSGT